MTIIVAYTPDEPSRHALRFAATEAQHRGEPVVVVNSSRGTAPVDRQLAEESDLEQIRSMMASANVAHSIEQPNRGNDPVEEVLAAIDNHKASMVVIGTRKRSPVGKLLLGSTAQQIILQSEVPVVAVKPV
ncbi:universal stress protein [Arthrobacter sp. NPDC089319]|uniref:universal stress protein n=1 Tax=Arthrobacter sp. NPDC089319 TaxID=3155915 RepID=UPI003414E2C1